MSTEQTPLAAWIRALVDACDLDPLGGGPRLRRVVDGWRASIDLDGEVVVVWTEGGRLRTEAQVATPVDGAGSTTSSVVLALLDGSLELSEAIADGWIDVVGHRTAVTRLFHAVEILLEVSARVPAMRDLASEFRRQRLHGTVPILRRDVVAERARELAVLGRLGLYEAGAGGGR